MKDPRVDFGAIFNAAPAPLLVLSSDAPAFTIVAANDAYLATTMTLRDEILGRPLFEVFPDNKADPSVNGTTNVRASLERMLATRAPDALPAHRYDIPRRRSNVREFEERHWTTLNSPVLNGPDSVPYINHCITDVTAHVRAGVLGQGGPRPRLSRIRVESSDDLPGLRDAVRDASAIRGRAAVTA